MPAAAETRVPPPKLAEFAAAVFIKVGMTEKDSRACAAALVRAETLGFLTHGMTRVKLHAGDIKEGHNEARPKIKAAAEGPGFALLDGGNGMGLIVAEHAAAKALALAEAGGLGAVAVRNSNSFGALAPYTLRAAERGFIGFCCTNFSGTIVAPPFSRKSLLGTNPLSLAVPAGRNHPFLLDMATSVVAGNKLRPYKESGKEVPWGWLQDKEGNIVTDTAKMMSLLPLGSTPELGVFKGYGLAAAVDILSGILSGGVYGNLKLRQGKKGDKTNTAAHFFAFLDPGRFRPRDEFLAAMDDWMDTVHAADHAPGVERVPVPGDREFAREADCLKNGAPLEEARLAELRRIAAEYGVAAPA